jgi:hypothetical protein
MSSFEYVDAKGEESTNSRKHGQDAGKMLPLRQKKMSTSTSRKR